MFQALKGNQRRAIKYLRKGIRYAVELKMPYEEALLHYQLGRLLPVGTTERDEHFEEARNLLEFAGATYNLQALDEDMARTA
jgi:hypothetical protein